MHWINIIDIPYLFLGGALCSLGLWVSIRYAKELLFPERLTGTTISWGWALVTAAGFLGLGLFQMINALSSPLARSTAKMSEGVHHWVMAVSGLGLCLLALVFVLTAARGRKYERQFAQQNEKKSQSSVEGKP